MSRIEKPSAACSEVNAIESHYRKPRGSKRRNREMASATSSAQPSGPQPMPHKRRAP